MKDKISLAGDLGSGKSTVSEILIERLGAEYYSTGAIVRSVAKKRGMTIGELNKYMETHPEIDREIDDGLVALGEEDRLLIIDSRMAWHFIPGTFKVYLSVDIETSALRIMGASRQGENAATLEEMTAQTAARRDSEKKRYLDQYGVNIKDLSNYSLIVDTTAASPAEVADCICDSFERWQADKSHKAAYISPERLNLPDTELDGERVSALCEQLELGSDIGFVELTERDGEFYLISGFEIAMAYSLAFKNLIPARLVKCEPPKSDFVRMKNSL